MSSWDTNPWSNFYDPHWELICCNKWHPGTPEISTPPHYWKKLWERTSVCEHGTKTTLLFLPADGEASWLLVQSLVSLLSGSTEQPENTYSLILRVTGQVWESQKRITLITTTTSIHLLKPVSTDLTIKPDSVLTSTIGKEGLPTKTKEAPSPHEV